MDVITATTVFTTNHSVSVYNLGGGYFGMLEYHISVGDVMIATLLTILVVMQTVQTWREWR